MDVETIALVERLLVLIETAHEHGDEEAIHEQAKLVRAALQEKHDG